MAHPMDPVYRYSVIMMFWHLLLELVGVYKKQRSSERNENCYQQIEDCHQLAHEEYQNEVQGCRNHS